MRKWIFCVVIFSALSCYNHAFAQSLLQQLPLLNSRTLSFQQSSYDRTGLNNDRIAPEYKNYYDVIPMGKVNNPSGVAGNRMEYVICHIQGPAMVERFWMITFPLNFQARLRFYFDGESTPRINQTFQDLFLTQNAPYNKPLVQNLIESSGGFYSYMKMPVAKSLIVTIDTAAVFCQFQARQLPRDTVVQSWTAAYNQSALIQAFNASGNYPKDNWAQAIKDSTTFSIAPREQKTIFSGSGQNAIEAIQMQFPDLDYSWSDFVYDKGYFHKGTSRFRMNINGTAQQVLLIKRSNKIYHLDFNFKNLSENAALRVDNQYVGVWQNKNYRTYRYWQNDTFVLPRNFYQNKSQINLQLQYQSGDPWNEFYYWISCDGVVTDSLDVGTPTSETAHNYTVSNVQANLYSELNNRYDAPEAIKKHNRQLLDSVYIHIYYDNELSPSVSAPAGLFFGTGVNDAAYMKSIPCGNVNGWYYNYFTMPYWQNVRIVVENKSNRGWDNIACKWATAPHNYSPYETGYFKTILRRETKGYTDATDYLVADIHGKGAYVGTVIEANQNNDTVFCWLEGDEHVYVDGAQTPAFIGTGTEDYFNSTFYFFFDEYSLPQNGMTNSDKFYHRSMYRFHLTDPIYFENNLRFQIEHGDYNNKLGNYLSLAFYYWRPSVLRLTDSLDVGNAASEIQHQYQTGSSKIFLQKTAAFEGEKYLQTAPHNGFAIADSVSWTATILPDNKGVRLLRTFDFSYKNQRAKVYVDDTLTGEWLNAGFNNAGFVRDDFFDIPERYTRGKSSLQIKLVNTTENGRWTELYYKVFTLADTAIATRLPVKTAAKNYTIYPTLTRDMVRIEMAAPQKWSWQLYDGEGRLLQQQERPAGAPAAIDLSGNTPGMYFVRILQQDKVSHTEKVILLH